MSKHSKIVNPSMEKCIPRFERNEVILGDMLGAGGFNDVFEVKRIDLVKDLSQAKHAKKISSPLQSEHRAFVAKHTFRESSQNCRYAIKFLSVDTIGDPSRFCTGAADLVVVSVVSAPMFFQGGLYSLLTKLLVVVSRPAGSQVFGVYFSPQHH